MKKGSFENRIFQYRAFIEISVADLVSEFTSWSVWVAVLVVDTNWMCARVRLGYGLMSYHLATDMMLMLTCARGCAAT